MGTVRRMVPGWPGAPFSTTWDVKRKAASHHMWAGQTLRWPSQAPREDPRGLLCSRTGPWGEERARHAAPGSLLAARGQWRFWEQQ